MGVRTARTKILARRGMFENYFHRFYLNQIDFLSFTLKKNLRINNGAKRDLGKHFFCFSAENALFVS